MSFISRLTSARNVRMTANQCPAFGPSELPWYKETPLLFRPDYSGRLASGIELKPHGLGKTGGTIDRRGVTKQEGRGRKMWLRRDH